jgi:hypothetical protein
LKQLAQRPDMLLDPECNIERTILEEFEQGVPCPRTAAESAHPNPGWKPYFWVLTVARYLSAPLDSPFRAASSVFLSPDRPR